MYLKPILMDCHDQNVVLGLVILQLWYHCDPQTVIPSATKIINSTNLRHLWFWLCNTHLVRVFLPYKMTQAGGGFLSGEQQIIFLCLFFSLFPKCHEASAPMISDVAICKVVPRTVQSNHTTVSTNTLGMNSNRSCVRWQQERPAGENRLKLVICLIIISHPAQQDLSCIEFRLGVERGPN